MYNGPNSNLHRVLTGGFTTPWLHVFREPHLLHSTGSRLIVNIGDKPRCVEKFRMGWFPGSYHTSINARRLWRLVERFQSM